MKRNKKKNKMNNEKIKNLVKEVLDNMKISYNEISVNDSEGRVRASIQSDESKFLIGNQGQNLQALNHIVKRMAEKKEIDTPFSVDVNNYQENALESIRKKALVIADRVRSFKTSIEMDPMTSYERMVVHSVLSEQPNINTESSGFGRERRVVVKYSESTINSI